MYLSRHLASPFHENQPSMYTHVGNKYIYIYRAPLPSPTHPLPVLRHAIWCRFARGAPVASIVEKEEVTTCTNKKTVVLKGQLGVPLTVYPWYLWSVL